jgi:hypothetical protein
MRGQPATPLRNSQPPASTHAAPAMAQSIGKGFLEQANVPGQRARHHAHHAKPYGKTLP